MPRARASSRAKQKKIESVESTADISRDVANRTVQQAPETTRYRSENNSTVPGIVLSVWGATFLYGALIHALTGCGIMVMPIFYVCTMLCFYVWHWLAHQRWTGTMHKIHMIHHFEWFPPDRFFGDDKHKVNFNAGMFFPGYGNLVHEGPLYVLIAAVLFMGYYAFGLSLLTVGLLSAYAVVFGTLGVALHTSFHVKGFPLERYQWYRELRALHYVHHLGSTQMNYAVLCMSFDKLFGSFVPDFEEALRKKRAAKRKKSGQSEDSEDDEEATSTDGKPLVIIDGIDPEDVKRALGAGGICAHVVGGHAPAALQPTKQPHDTAPVDRGWLAVLVRAAIVAAAVAFWFETQAFVDQRHFLCDRDQARIPEGIMEQAAATGLQDFGHCALGGMHAAVRADTGATVVARLFIVRVTDLLAVLLAATAVLSTSIRPALALLVLYTIRQLCVMLVDLPQPPGSLWSVCNPSSDPTASAITEDCQAEGLWGAAAFVLRSIPAVLQTEGVSQDLFFSAPAAVMTLAVSELCDRLLHWRRDAALGGRQFTREEALASPMEAPLDAYKGLWVGDWLSWAIVLVGTTAVVGTGLLVLVLQANWTMSVVVGVLCARYAVLVADYHNEWIESLLP